jgi:hypothetical protein
MQVQFTGSQSLSLKVPQEAIPVQHYLRQPQRLIHALADPSQVELLGENCFRMKMRSRQFLTLTIQPIVDIQIWHDPDGSLNLRSVGCEIRGVDYINQRFHLALDGQLTPEALPLERRSPGAAQLQGTANLTVGVALPPALWMTPKPLLEATGNGLLKSILLTMKQRLAQNLLADYRQWVKSVLAEDKRQLTGAGFTLDPSPVHIYGSRD